jgi:hypothetical protein
VHQYLGLMLLHILLPCSFVTHYYFILSIAKMYTPIISLLALASVSLGATIQVPSGDIYPEQAIIAQFEPPIFTDNERRETCTALRNNLTQEEIEFGDYLSKENFILSHHGIYRVDFMAYICEYRAELESILYIVSTTRQTGHLLSLKLVQESFTTDLLWIFSRHSQV